MARNVKLVQIEEGEAQVVSLEQQEQQMRQLYMADGVIDDTEQEALDRIKGKIERLRDAVAQIRAEVERNRDIWNGRAGDLSTLQGQLAELTAFGHAEATTVAGEFDAIDQAVLDERWADATAALDQATVSMEPVYADLLLEQAAQGRYEPARIDFNARLDALRHAEPLTEDLITGIAEVDGRIGTIDAAVTSLHFVEAEELLAETVLLLTPLEERLVQLQTDKAEYDAGLQAISSKLMDLSVSDFIIFQDRQAEIARVQTDMETAASTHDYPAALALLQNLTGLVDTLHPEWLALSNLRAEFDTDFAPLQARAAVLNSSEVASTADAMQTMLELQDAIEAAVQEENYETAIANLPPYEAAIVSIEEILSDRDLYEARLAAMQEELLEASQSRPEWTYLNPIQSQMATIQTAMETAAAAEDFETALNKIGELEGKLVEFFAAIEEKKTAYTNKRSSLDSQVRAAENDASPALSAEIQAVRDAIPPIDALATAEDWVAAAVEIDTAIDRISEFNAAMLQQDAPGMTTGMTQDILELAGRSPELTQSLEDLEAAGWQVVIGPAGEGSKCSSGRKTITIDQNRLAQAEDFIRSMSHEIGHAEYTGEPDMSSRERYLETQMADEGAATMENIRVQREIMANGGPDIGISGSSANHAEYNRIYDQYLIDGDAEAAQAEIARTFAAGEVPSVKREDGSSYADYNEYYGEYYDSLYWFQKL